MDDFIEQKRAALLDHLRRHVEGEVRFDDTTRRLYSTDASPYQIKPLGVVIPRTHQDLLATVQIAAETRTPIVARGGGTSLSGQSIGPGIVIDCAKYLNRVKDIDPSARTVRVQPGIVLDHLNRALAAQGFQFGPDVATASRATLGGMMGNNSAGARSIVYGMTVDHVRSLRTILADGSEAEFGQLAPAEWQRQAELPSRVGGLYRAVQRVVARNENEIAARFPRVLRRSSGYNLAAYVEGAGQPARLPAYRRPEAATSLVPLLIGSEGTLAVVAEAELNIIPLPKSRGLLVPHFSSLAAALDAVAACLEFNPSAVEVMDTLLLELAREQRSLKETMAFVHGRPAALLMVEFSGNDPAEVSAQVHRLQRRLEGTPGLTAAVPALEPAVRDPLWNFRRASMPLLYGIPGDRKPVTFIEDAAVQPERLPEFIARFRETLRKHGTDGAFYGHASVGCLHIRPVLNLKDAREVSLMRTITEEVTDLVLEFGGSLTGEHGDGLARSEWNLKMFGPAVYEAFREVKRAFDPENVLNPNKIVDAPAMTENLRYAPPYTPAQPPTLFDYSRQGGFLQSIELCNGAGVCRKTQGGAMCPSYRATRDERDNTRGRANALRHALAEAGRDGAEPEPKDAPLAERWVYDVLDLCLGCKACKAECPSSVDLAKLKAEFLHAYHARHPRPLGHRFLANVHRLYRLGAPVAGLVNKLSGLRLSRWLLEKLGGIDRRRSLPPLHRDHLRRWHRLRMRNAECGVRNEEGTALAGASGLLEGSSIPHSALRTPHSKRVLLFDDCFNTFNEPEVGRAAVRVLERAGCEVELVGPVCCGRPLISKGFLKEARDLAKAQIPELARRVADGTPILGLEPSCALTLADEWPELVPGPAAKQVAESVKMADQWIAEQVKAGELRLEVPRRAEKCLFHGHCHQRALCGVKGSAEALRLVPGLNVTVLDAGCCGMAGAFGYEKEHYDLSVKIANLELVPALKAEPEALVAATGTSCRHQIRDLTGRRALHPLEVLDMETEEE